MSLSDPPCLMRRCDMTDPLQSVLQSDYSRAEVILMIELRAVLEGTSLTLGTIESLDQNVVRLQFCTVTDGRDGA